MMWFLDGDLDDLIQADEVLFAAINRLADAVNEANVIVNDWRANHGLPPGPRNYFSLRQDKAQMKDLASFFKK
jgi:hypothetical protein